ncbi:MAG: hydrolase 1, exosortase A system-associated [Erythrobacter sp.]|uniref:hydrolase 1, exosortase A system-associated n=1 Tax=Erythrobacter sp. TaxID=1042 RepID=UPI00260A0F10|nr:hydrolase 1, exosortase A system-associated [Erythrobacter sp.]MDJ0977862.1 hydrolase 1, exosortase A system-associated [Erythrobacter sp.]
MSRLHLTFACGSLTLAGTLDTAPGKTGLLIVSGGNEVRSGAFSGQAQLAATIARAGFPVFRFDRRGIGDSEGENRGFRSSAKDIAAALRAFRAIAPDVERIVAFGNCNAASALMLTEGAGFDALVLANPWTIESAEVETDAADALPASAIRQRYAEKLKNPSEIRRLLTGGVSLRNLSRGLLQSVRSDPIATGLAQEIKAGLEAYSGPVSILLSGDDRAAQAFESSWDSADPRIERCAGAGHAFVEPPHREWLYARILTALRASLPREQADELDMR